MQARNPQFEEASRKQVGDLQNLGWYHSIALPSGEVIRGFQSLEQLQWRLAQFPLPERLPGKRVLDIGAWDGWFTFEMERRGASVVAVDSTIHERFLTARDALGAQADYRVADIQKLSPADVGFFDIVLFFGVLYHLKHPLLALENVCRLTTDMALIESYVHDDGSDLNAPPLMEFYEGTELRGQFDNWVGPNTSCLLAMCRTAGFARCELRSVVQNRAHVICYRKWDGGEGDGAAPILVAARNSVSGDDCYRADEDEYLSIWFKSDAAHLDCNNVFPQIGPYGSRPVSVSATGGSGWQLNCKLPLGLAEESYEVSLHTAGSKRSEGIAIHIGNPPQGAPGVLSTSTEALHIELVTDGVTWTRGAVQLGERAWMSLWIAGLPEWADRNSIEITVDGESLPVDFVSSPDSRGVRQLNVPIPVTVLPGLRKVAAIYNGVISDPMVVDFTCA